MRLILSEGHTHGLITMHYPQLLIPSPGRLSTCARILGHKHLDYNDRHSIDLVHYWWCRVWVRMHLDLCAGGDNIPFRLHHIRCAFYKRKGKLWSLKAYFTVMLPKCDSAHLKPCGKAAMGSAGLAWSLGLCIASRLSGWFRASLCVVRVFMSHSS